MEVHARQGKASTGPTGVLLTVLAKCTRSDMGAVVQALLYEMLYEITGCPAQSPMGSRKVECAPAAACDE